MMTNFPLHQIAAPAGWFRKETVTFLSFDGHANVIVSCEPVDPTLRLHTSGVDLQPDR